MERILIRVPPETSLVLLCGNLLGSTETWKHKKTPAQFFLVRFESEDQ
jgi:hypothetical protein